MMNLKEIGTEQSWSNQNIVPPFAWRNSGGKKKKKKKEKKTQDIRCPD
jgi:hypothetical protein